MPRYTRRTLIRSVAYAGAGATLASGRLVRAVSSNSKLRHAPIGAGGMGWVDIQNLTRDPRVEVVAICDVDTTRQGKAAEKFPDAKRYQDWRRLFDKEHAQIDSVNVTVPDHSHASITLSAMSLGKHAYCQKPLTHSVHEARRIALAAARHKEVVTQMGIQNHAGLANRLTVRLIQDRAVGRVKQVHAWVPFPTPDLYPLRVTRPMHTDNPPASLDWDAWLGPAPYRPYIAAYAKSDPNHPHPPYHPFYWRSWRAFGGGILADFGCHLIDPVVVALELGPPAVIRAEGPASGDESFGDWNIVRYRFPATRFTEGPLDLTWYHGGKRPPADLVAESDRAAVDIPMGTLYVGTEGALLATQNAPRLLPSERFEGVRYPKLDPNDHYLEFVGACLGETRTDAPFAFSGPLTETVLLGNVAIAFSGEPLHWNASKFRFNNNTRANDMLMRDYRKGWRVEGLG